MHDNDWDNKPFEPRPTEVCDPVCGVWLDPRHSAGTRVTRAGSVFFCSTLCLEKFDLNSAHYLPEPDTTGPEADAEHRR